MTRPLPAIRAHSSALGAPSTTSHGFGLIYGLAFGLTVWGYDASVLVRSHAELAGLKLLIGLPALALLGVAAGYLLGRRAGPAAWVAVWLVTGSLMGLFTASLPYTGYTAAVWLLEPGLRGVAVHPIPPAHMSRTLLFTALMAGVGAVTGLVGYQASQRAEKAAIRSTRLAIRSWAALSVCLPLAALPALTGDELVNRSLRDGFRATSEGLSGRVSGGYRLHTIVSSAGVEDAVVDVSLADGLTMRCDVFDSFMTECLVVSPRYRAWMDDIVQAVVADPESPAVALDQGVLLLAVGALTGLDKGPEGVSADYVIIREGQYRDWVVMSARFDSSTRLTCYFHGRGPVVVDHCMLS